MNKLTTMDYLWCFGAHVFLLIVVSKNESHPADGLMCTTETFREEVNWLAAYAILCRRQKVHCWKIRSLERRPVHRWVHILSITTKNSTWIWPIITGRTTKNATGIHPLLRWMLTLGFCLFTLIFDTKNVFHEKDIMYYDFFDTVCGCVLWCKKDWRIWQKSVIFSYIFSVKISESCVLAFGVFT